MFNDVSPVDETQMAELIQKLMTGPIDPWQIVTPEWCRKRLDISEEEFQKWAGEQDKRDEEEMKLHPPPPNPFQPGVKPPAEQPSEEVK